MSKFIHHPAFAAIMTLIVAQQWFSLGMQVHNGWTSLLAFHLVLAPIATVAVILYHYSSRKVAFFNGKIEGIDTALRGSHV
ncbi:MULTISPECIES: hypothetical protein [unclassified Brevibacterium]|uniref:hypothetical protein n=1 Tax=unclassified Brevibacterium TaxID=2614124 RepID=UPI001E33A6C7|nr:MULTISPECIES: hypothetical protein [unclassified Brevibacterium]MCD1287328.1 hypothetical protein [Brevibacterium sp. CCUG 69071]MDK8436417.1 hypothetical protein [Brevibacterium sp. H-BE7]